MCCFSFYPFKMYSKRMKRHWRIRLEDGRVLVDFRFVCVLSTYVDAMPYNKYVCFDNVIALTLTVANLLVKSLLLSSLATRVDCNSLLNLEYLLWRNPMWDRHIKYFWSAFDQFNGNKNNESIPKLGLPSGPASFWISSISFIVSFYSRCVYIVYIHI